MIAGEARRYGLGMLRFLLTLCMLALPLPAAAFEGVLRVIDADTFDVGDVRVRLFGVDAPEIGQPCAADGEEWDCGRWARDQVRDRFEGQWVQCTTQDVDRYERIVARCQAQNVDIGETLVQEGWAWAYLKYSSLYEFDEKAAAVTGRGLWAVEIERPAAYRATLAAGPDAPDPACAIKGNISDNGRIYHMPGSRIYARTSINLNNGERWFCSPAQAEAAGWRAAGQPSG